MRSESAVFDFVDLGPSALQNLSAGLDLVQTGSAAYPVLYSEVKGGENICKKMTKLPYVAGMSEREPDLKKS